MERFSIAFIIKELQIKTFVTLQREILASAILARQSILKMLFSRSVLSDWRCHIDYPLLKSNHEQNSRQLPNKEHSIKYKNPQNCHGNKKQQKSEKLSR